MEPSPFDDRVTRSRPYGRLLVGPAGDGARPAGRRAWRRPRSRDSPWSRAAPLRSPRPVRRARHMHLLTPSPPELYGGLTRPVRMVLASGEVRRDGRPIDLADSARLEGPQSPAAARALRASSSTPTMSRSSRWTSHRGLSGASAAARLGAVDMPGLARAAPGPAGEAACRAPGCRRAVDHAGRIITASASGTACSRDSGRRGAFRIGGRRTTARLELGRGAHPATAIDARIRPL